MYICGQKNILSKIDYLIKENKFPKFSLILGDYGFGKKVISDYISRRLGTHFVPCGTKAEDVKDVINDAYSVVEPTLYMFSDCDDMSSSSKNSLLKVTEEPPRNVYFIMTACDKSSILDTIISRAYTFQLEPYSQKDILDFVSNRALVFSGDDLNIVKNICVCPNDALIASTINISDVYSLADKFIQFIGSANLANELKITQSLNLKKEESPDKIDPIIFLKCIIFCCNEYIIKDISTEDIRVFYNIINETRKALHDFTAKGANKQMCIDNWILNTHLSIVGGGNK